MYRFLLLILVLTSIYGLRFNAKSFLSNTAKTQRYFLSTNCEFRSTTVVPVPAPIPIHCSINNDVGINDSIIDYPIGTSYGLCGSCKSAFLLNPQDLGSEEGCKVQCSVCHKTWFQTADKLMKTDELHKLIPIRGMKNNEEGSSDNSLIPQHTTGNAKSVGIFVKNIPDHYGENEVCDLFAEYGVVSVTVPKGAEQNSRGYAFVNIATSDDAALLLEEMKDFYVEPGKKLAVSLITEKPKSSRYSHSNTQKAGYNAGSNSAGSGSVSTGVGSKKLWQSVSKRSDEDHSEGSSSGGGCISGSSDGGDSSGYV